MLGLLGEHTPCFLFRQIFLERLPERVRSVLVHSEVKDIRQLAQAADRLHESYIQAEGTAEVNRVTQKPNKKDKQKKERQADNGLCFYHNRFGAKAHKCIQPCSWQQENSSTGSQ